MRLLSLRLRNFQGIRDLTLNADGDDVSIYGDNGTGKTTIFNAFLWLLFEKNSEGKKDFDIKTLTPDGKPIGGIDHEVEGIFEIKGHRLTLKKTYKEVYKKKRGTATSEFSGHTTDHYIDGVPVPEKDYAAKIAEIADETVFKLLTSPTYFNTQLHWQKRREILLSVCGDVTDADVIASDKALAGLPDILKNRKLDDHRKVIAPRRAEINKELEKIPIRIDEAAKALPDIAGIDAYIIPGKITDLRARVRLKNDEIARIQGGGEVAEKVKTLREVEAKMLDIRTRHRSQVEDRVEAKMRELRKLKDDISGLLRSIEDKERIRQGNSRLIAEAETSANKLREEWHKVNGQQFEFSQDIVCPICGQSLPEERLTEARENALADFNREKAETLEDINARGKGHKATAVRLKSENEAIEKYLQADREKLGGMEIEVDSLKKSIDTMIQAACDITQNQEYVQVIKDKEAIEGQINGLKEGNAGQIAGVKAEVSMLEYEIASLERSLAQVDQHKKGQKRIEELMAQEKALAAEFERLEKELHLTDLFTKAKVALLDNIINSKFKLVRFKMFNELVNGGVEPCCEAIYNGVPYSSGLNNGHRGIVGLDIISTLSEHYDFFPPIFYDNAESVTRLPEMKNQMICLYVSERDKSLRVEL